MKEILFILESRRVSFVPVVCKLPRMVFNLVVQTGNRETDPLMEAKIMLPCLLAILEWLY